MPRRLGLILAVVLCVSTTILAAASTGRTRSGAVALRAGARGSAASHPLWCGLAPGHHAVGYRRLADSSVTVHVWYPARAGGEPLSFAAYLDADSAQVRTFLLRTGIGAPSVDGLFGSRMYAAASAEPESELPPLILVAQGNQQDAADQVVLCEYLASHGYAVATTPSPMKRTPMESEAQVAEFAERQATELATAVSRVAAAVPVDTMHIGLIAHSLGARAALLLAMRDSRMRALVSLDGGIGTATAVEPFERSPSFHADAALPPVLHFYETLDAFMTPDFTLLRSLHVRALTLRATRAMHHVHFTTYGFAAGADSAVRRVTGGSRETRASVVEVARDVREFLVRWLK